MKISDILVQGHPSLNEACAPVCFPDTDLDDEINRLHGALDDFRNEKGFGRAIAAPQLGIQKRFIALNLGASPFVVINPEITWKSDEMFEVWDDCLSVPDSVVKVRRYASISLRFQDRDGRLLHWKKLPEELSELLQHEMDHLDGVLMTDRATDKADIRPISDHNQLIGSARKTIVVSLDDIVAASD
jgi:peptide deformylase